MKFKELSENDKGAICGVLTGLVILAIIIAICEKFVKYP